MPKGRNNVRRACHIGMFESVKNKFVITGPPSSGKTTILDILQQRGIKVLSDTSREILLKKEEYGVDINDIAFSDLIFEKQLEKEFSLDENEVCLLDMSLVECIVFRKLKRQSLDLLSEIELRQRYDDVFLFSPLPFENDGYRDENDEQQINKIYELIKETYLELGYTARSIPRLPIDQRLKMIIDFLRSKGVAL